MALGMSSDCTHVSETPFEAGEGPLSPKRSTSSPSPRVHLKSNMAAFTAGADWRAKMDALDDEADKTDEEDANNVLRHLLTDHGADTSALTVLETSRVEADEDAESVHIVKKSQKRVLLESDEEEDAAATPIIREEDMPTIREKQRQRMQLLAEKKRRTLPIPDDFADVPDSKLKRKIIAQGLDSDSDSSSPPASDGASTTKKEKIKRKRKSKSNDDKDKPKKKKALSKKELDEVQQTTFDLKKKQRPSLAPTFQKEFNIKTLTDKFRTQTCTPTISQSTKSSLPPSSRVESSTPEDNKPSALEAHAQIQAVDEEETQDLAFLESQSQTESYMYATKSSSLPLQSLSSSSKIAGILEETDPIEATSPFDPIPRKASETVDVKSNLNASATLNAKKRLAMQRLQARAQSAKRISDASDSDSDLEILATPVPQPQPSNTVKFADPRSTLASFRMQQAAQQHRKGASETQFERAAKTWGPTASSNTSRTPATNGQPVKKLPAKAPITHASLTLNLQAKIRLQNATATEKKRQTYLANGGRVRKEEKLTEAEQQQAALKATDTIALFKENADNDRNATDDEEEEADSDYQEDEGQLSGDEIGSGSEQEQSQDQSSDQEVENEIVDGEAVENDDSASDEDMQSGSEETEKVSPSTPSEPQLGKEGSASTLSPTQIVGSVALNQAGPAGIQGIAFNGFDDKDDLGFSQMFEEEEAANNATQMFAVKSQAERGLLQRVLQAEPAAITVSQSVRDRAIDEMEAEPLYDQRLDGPVVIGKAQYMNSQGLYTQTRQILRTTESLTDLDNRKEDKYDGQGSQSTFAKRIMKRITSNGFNVMDTIEQEETEADEDDDQHTFAESMPTQQPISTDFQPTFYALSEETQSQAADEIPAAQPYRNEDAMDTSLDIDEDVDGQMATVESPAELAHDDNNASASEDEESDSEGEPSTGAKAEMNAFNVLMQGKNATEPLKANKKMNMNNFVLDQAEESDEEEGMFAALRKNLGDDENEDEDDDGVIEGLVDDEKVDATIQAEQDKAAEALAKEHELQRDQKLQKQVERDARGAWRHKRRADELLDESDYSDDEFGTSKRSKDKSKKRKLAGKDEMDAIATNPETQAFAAAYIETCGVRQKEGEYNFLQGEEQSPSDEELEEAQEAQERISVHEVFKQMKELAARRQREGHKPVDLAGTSSSPPPGMKVRDRTVIQVKPKNRFNQGDNFDDLELQYMTHEREETQHQRQVRAQEAKNGPYKRDDIMAKAGQNSSITSMTRKPSALSSRTSSTSSTSSSKSLSKKASTAISKEKLGPVRQNSLLGLKSRAASFKR